VSLDFGGPAAQQIYISNGATRMQSGAQEKILALQFLNSAAWVKTVNFRHSQHGATSPAK
jgi:hypothetical protein